MIYAEERLKCNTALHVVTNFLSVRSSSTAGAWIEHTADYKSLFFMCAVCRFQY